MKNFKYSGQTFTYVVAGSNIVSGEARVVGDLFGVATRDGIIGEEVEMQKTGVFELKKEAALAMVQGDIAYYDTVLKEITDDNTKVLVGSVHKAADGADSVVEVFSKHGAAAFNGL